MHVGADMTEIHAKRGFRFVDPYEKKTILNLNGSVWYVNPASINAFTVAGDALVTHRVRERTTLQTNLEKLFFWINETTVQLLFLGKIYGFPEKEK